MTIYRVNTHFDENQEARIARFSIWTTVETLRCRHKDSDCSRLRSLTPHR